MKKLVFVSFAMSVLGGISESAYGMFNAQDETQNADNGKLLTHEKLPENEREEGHQSEVYNYQIGDLREQVSRLTTLVETSLANEERKSKEKDQSEIYNYQIGDLKAQISRLTTLVETSLANEKRKDEEQKQSEVYNYQIGNLGARLSSLRTLVQNLNEKVTALNEEKESLIARNVVKSRESTERKLKQAEESVINQRELDRAEKSNADKFSENKEIDETSSDVSATSSAEVNTSSVNQYNAKSIIENKLTELLKVKNGNAINKRMEEFSALVEGVYGERTSEWIGSTDIKIENNEVRFIDTTARAYGLSIDRIKKFLENVQEEIEQCEAQRNNKQRVLEELQSRGNSVASSANGLSSHRDSVSEQIQKSEALAVAGSLDVKNAKSVTEEIFTELLKVAEEKAVKEKIQEFYDLIAGNVLKSPEGTERNEGAEKAQAPSNKSSVKANSSSTDLINAKSDLTTSKGSIFKGKQTYASPSSSVEDLSYYDNNGSNSNLFGMSSANSVSDEGYQEYMREREFIEAGDNSYAFAAINVDTVTTVGARGAQAEESNADKLAENKGKTISKASAKIDIDSLTYVNAKSAIEEAFNELKNVAGAMTMMRAYDEFCFLVEANEAKGWKIWDGELDMSIEKNEEGGITFKFKDPQSQVNPFGLDRIKKFLEDVQKDIEEYKAHGGHFYGRHRHHYIRRSESNAKTLKRRIPSGKFN